MHRDRILWAASTGAEVHYRLPWPEGRSFMFTQVPGGQITTHFTKATAHAVDIAMPEGVPVLAARAGIVEAVQAHHRAGPDDEPLTYEGNFVRVRHADGTAATYAHLGHQGVVVAVGEAIEVAQLLGYSGASGDVVAPHLHFVVTRVQQNSAGWREEVSIPVKFYIGEPRSGFRAASRGHRNGELLAPRGISARAKRRRLVRFVEAPGARGGRRATRLGCARAVVRVRHCGAGVVLEIFQRLGGL